MIEPVMWNKTAIADLSDEDLADVASWLERHGHESGSPFAALSDHYERLKAAYELECFHRAGGLLQ